jgi:hypothetical protein
MFGLVTEARVTEHLAVWAAHLERVDRALERAQQQLAAQEAEIQALRAELAAGAEGPGSRPDRLPSEVRAAIANRCGRGNVNRRALLETSARLMLDDPGADPRDVAELLLRGTGDFEV